MLNWRARFKLGDRHVTEQIYVHTKLMIVDDRFALFGSANINDRNLLGERDSELAMLVMDGDSFRADINGKGSKRPVRRFAHELRKSVWKKIFGITGGVRPATGLAQAIEQPGSPDSWRSIQIQANANAELYESAFRFIPRNWSGRVSPTTGEPLPASIIPTWDPSAPSPPNYGWGNTGFLSSALPSQEAFWSQWPASSASVAALERVKGFITALPVYWTRGEDNKIAFPTSLIVENGPLRGRVPGQRDTVPVLIADVLSPNGESAAQVPA